MIIGCLWSAFALAEPVEETVLPEASSLTDTGADASPELVVPTPEAEASDTGTPPNEPVELQHPPLGIPTEPAPPTQPAPQPLPVTAVPKPVEMPEPQGPPAPRFRTLFDAPEPREMEEGSALDRVDQLVDQLVPTLGRRGPQALFGLALIALIALALASGARTLRGRLRPVGLLPSFMVGIEIFGRAIAVIVALTAIVALLPVGIVPALTWIAIGAALAVGWSLSGILPDVLAWVVLATEGRLLRGVWVRTGELHGAIESFTLRSVQIIDVQGQRISIPNRLLLQQPLQASTESFPKTQVTLRLPDLEAAVARRILWESAMLSPWLAPTTTPEIGQDPSDPSRWRVSVELLEGAYEDDFSGSFPERVREVLAAHTRPAA